MEMTLHVEDKLEEPKAGMLFNTIDEVKEYYKRYGNELGFPIKNRTSKKGDDGECIYVSLACSLAGKATSTSRNIRRRLPSRKTDCKAKLSVAICPDGKWQVTSFRADHNHALSPGAFGKGNLELNDTNSCVVETSGYENVSVFEKDFRNYTDIVTRLRLGQGDASAIHNHFMKMQADNSNFFYMMDLDDEGCLRNVFWADARSRTSYEEFGDTITFDTTYITNKYDMPFASFVGVNHHGQLTLLGCALLSGEDTETFTWLFQCWLVCMSGCAPKAIIIDQEKSIQRAIEIVFPNTRHRWCLSHIMRKLPENLRGYIHYESIKFALQDIIYDSLTHDEFEERWSRMIEHCSLQSNEWLLDLYDERQRWVPAFLKDAFWAGMPTTQHGSFFDGYVNSKTSLKQFVEQYENILRSKVEKEKHEDLNSFSSRVPCITHYAMEKQFQDSYTTTKYKEFQHELTGKIYCEMSSVKKDGAYSEYDIYEDLKVGEMDRRVIFKVSLIHDDCDIHCSCCLFESSGILCRHAIVVLTHNKILSVPEKYIIPRWRKDSKRRHTRVKISYDDWSSKPEAGRFDKMCNAFHEVAHLSTDSEDMTKMVVDWINDLEKELKRDKGISGQPTNKNDGTTSSADDVVIVSPPLKRKQSKEERAVRKNKEKRKRRKNTTNGNRMQESQMIEGGSSGAHPALQFAHANMAWWGVAQNGQPSSFAPPMLAYGHGYGMNNTTPTTLSRRAAARQNAKLRKILPRHSDQRSQMIPLWMSPYGMVAVPNPNGMPGVNDTAQPYGMIAVPNPNASSGNDMAQPYYMVAVPNPNGVSGVNDTAQPPNVIQPTVHNLEEDNRPPPTVENLEEDDRTQPTVEDDDTTQPTAEEDDRPQPTVEEDDRANTGNEVCSSA